MASLFKNAAYNYTPDTIEPPKHIPKRNEQVSNQPNILVPSFIVSLSQSIISFFLRKTSRLPIIGTKNGEIREFTIDEFHILVVTLLGFSIHYTRKYRNICFELKQSLNKLLIESKIHNFDTLAACDYNNIKRIECTYYKNQFQLYDIDLESRTELRTFIQTLMSQSEVLSGLTLKILEAMNALFKKQRINELKIEYKNKNKDKDFIHRQNRIDEYFDGEEERVDKYQSFFDDKNEQYLIENRETQRQITEKELLDLYKNHNQQKQIEIDAKISINNSNNNSNNNNNDDNKMTEEDDKQLENQQLQTPLQKRRLQMKYDYEYLKKQADNLPIQQMDFSSKQISKYNLQKEVNNMKYNIILNQETERRTEKIRKYGIISCIVVTTAFTYWYNRHYDGKGVIQNIRDAKCKLYSYF